MSSLKDYMELKQTFKPHHGELVGLTDQLSRITAPNSGPFTFHGTNTYLVGKDSVAIIDPGPIIDDHISAIIKAVGNRPVTHIIVTHTHADHSPAAKTLAKHFNAATFGEGQHRPSRDLYLGESNPLDASADKEFNPDVIVTDGEIIAGEGWTLEAVATPGHTANHLTFCLKEENILLSGDHVMAWSTSIVAPPDGSMSDFMASLDVLMARDEHLFFPGHGGRVEKPDKFMRGLKTHRLMREASILDRLQAGDRNIPDMVKVMYATTNPKLHGAAGLSVLAHLEDLVARGLVETQGPPAIDGVFAPKA
ncbi:MAG: MBL fold metallo-hydrolase [Hyphomicrobiales bacterium]